ncbi:hypothetical protein H2198_001457 [Neophaeococcomyces mojaviensis]|uniref:Uncharacterized protein n=1 Tax=Neophaeococcomyces mojaviensis TaxID=3383035 RepID=A0ACC3AHG6_9EURO|nr:hypothetical protein H2198_001457 [Knufia sp. JES_112]
MSNQSNLSKGTVLIISGAAAIALCCLTYRHFLVDERGPTNTKLHRRNAVRRTRPRRRWRRGFQPVELDYDPLARALERLTQREESGEGYGLYTNKYYVSSDLLDSHKDDFVLLPSKLDGIHGTIVQTTNLPPDVASRLKLHIHIVFIGNFLKEEWPRGYLIDGDIDDLAESMSSVIDPATFRKCAKTFDQTGHTMQMDYECLTSTDEAEHSRAFEDDMPAADLAPAMSATELSGQLAASGRLPEDDEEQGQGQNVLDLLYRIGEEQAKRSGYQHRGVECNGCAMQPIRGIRYHCANCWDYDLCESCEAQQIHHKTHVFYKIRIPAPTRGQIKLVQPKWYPGNPNACPESIPGALKETLLKETDLDRQDLDALYDQFKCIAGHSSPGEAYEIEMAIDRDDFHRYFTTTTADRPPKPNLIHDRIFAFYDQDDDGLINFAEFARGMAELANNTSRQARIERLFKAFDLDRDGYVERKDFIRMLRANYALNKELAHEIIYAREDAVLADEEIYEVIRGNNPISAAFGGSHFAGHHSRHGAGKHVDINGDSVLENLYDEILQEDSEMAGNRAEAIARHASGGHTLLESTNPESSRAPRDEPIIATFQDYFMFEDQDQHDANEALERFGEGVDHLRHTEQWPDEGTQEVDVVLALGSDVPLHDVLDPLDRQRILFNQRQREYRKNKEELLEMERNAVEKRWERRQFYFDENEGLAGPNSEPELVRKDQTLVEAAKPSSQSNIRRTSLRSRSSSTGRIDDCAIDTEGSLHNRYFNERWGSFGLGEPDREVGQEIIYEAIQEAFMEMLDHFFKDKEDKAMASYRIRLDRKRDAEELQKYDESLRLDGASEKDVLKHTDKIRTEALRTGREFIEQRNQDPGQDQAINATNDSANLNNADQEARPDPTLPQNRPNEVFKAPDEEEKSEIVFDVCGQSYLINPMLLPWWHGLNMADQEAKERNGYGKLSLQEFKQKLRDDMNDDKGGMSQTGTEHEFWEAKADLGRFSFLSTWLEMASF